MASEIHQNDIGTRFLITVKDDGDLVDISNASIRQLTFKKPSDSTIVRTALIFNDGSALSGVMYYDSDVGDLDEIGFYKLQAKGYLPSGTYYTDIHTFKADCNL